uniref:Uncharacterized protein n=1 Tax=Rhizophora mucronata TaxID=61149 RepID=A0A2P2JAB9_RHIMU
MKRTRPPSLSFILLNTNLSHIEDGFLPAAIACIKPIKISAQKPSHTEHHS